MKRSAQAQGPMGQNTPEATLEGLTNARQRQLRVLLSFTGAGILAIAVVILLAGHLLIGRFEQVERDDALQKAAQLYHAAEADFRQLSITNHNNAEWDDAVDFVATRSQNFIRSNFTATTMDGLHADLAWIVDRDGQTLYAGLYDRPSHILTSAVPPALLAELRGFLRSPGAAVAGAANGATDGATDGAAAAQVVRTSLGPMAVSATEITRTDRSAPSGAMMVLARLLGAEEMIRISETSQLPVSYTLLADPPTRGTALPEAVSRWIRESGSGSGSTMAWALDPSAIDGYALIRDFEGAPVAVLSTPLPRKIHSLGVRTTSWLLGSISLVLVVFTSAILLLVLRLRGTLADYEAAQERLRRLSRQLQDMVVLADPNDLRILDANDAVLRKMNCSLSVLRTRRVGDLYPALAAGQLDLNALDPRGALYEATPMMADRASRSLADVTVTRLIESDRSYLCFVATDVTHRRQVDDLQRQNKRDLSHMAQHDALTGLPNRLYLQTRMRRTLRQAVGGIELNAVYYLNLDDFHSVNESRGQGVGDQILQVLAKRLRAIVQTRHVVARIGGDEFAVIVPLLPDLAAVDALAEKLQAVVQAPILIERNALSVSASIGIALFPDHGSDMQSVLKHAEIAMHSAKQAGQHCHRMFSLDMNLRIKGRTDLLQSLKDALGTTQFHMEYQPIYDMKSGRITSLEALARWEHPELGSIPPKTFIAAAEQGNEMLALGKQILDMVFGDLRQWLADQVPLVPVSINISSHQIERTDFAALVAQYCQESGIDQRYIGIEVSEKVFLQPSEHLHRTLTQLRLQGSRIVIDDFGTGASNLTSLDTLPVDVLKIDQAFVHDIAGNAGRLSIVRAIVDMAHSLRMTTVAVGIETIQQMALLTEHRCDFAQGLFLRGPLPASECRSLLQQTPNAGAATASTVPQALSAS